MFANSTAAAAASHSHRSARPDQVWIRHNSKPHFLISLLLPVFFPAALHALYSTPLSNTMAAFAIVRSRKPHIL